MDTLVKNVLADRYASPAMADLWSETGKIRLERKLWIAVMLAQKELGIAIPGEAISAYERVVDRIDLDSIRKREKETRHDVKARIDEFCELAGFQHIHKGLTSRDLTENVEQLQVAQALRMTVEKAISSLSALGDCAERFRDLVLAGRTHNVPAQPTTLGKRFAMFGEEFILAIAELEHFLNTYPVRGLKGAVGTQTDQITLFDGDLDKTSRLEASMLRHLGLPALMTSVGQVYPRSLDFALISKLYALSAAPSNFARTIRLMAGHEAASEGFAKGQTGSSAMPHKMNSRSCERIHGFRSILAGHVTMASALAGDQWHEGDVSCSVVRRVVLPDGFFAIDGLLNTFLSVLQQLTVYPAVIGQELEQYAPFLLTTTILMEAVKKGIGREDAHHLIKTHAVAEIETRRQSGNLENHLIDRLAADPTFPLDQTELERISHSIRNQTGNALRQIDSFLSSVSTLKARHPGYREYGAADIL